MIFANCGSVRILPSFFDESNRPFRLPGKNTMQDPSRAPGDGQKILVVDDETAIADSLAEILSDHGFEALAAYDGAAAIATAREICPDVVLCDVVMPQLNGVDTAIAIREACPRARIFLFSGQAGTIDILKNARAQGHSFEVLAKPMHPDELLGRIFKKRN
jgi:DNA-binding response OmpR family regulator